MGRPKGRLQNSTTATGRTNETDKTELNQNVSVQNDSPEKDCSNELEKMTPVIYKA